MALGMNAITLRKMCKYLHKCLFFLIVVFADSRCGLVIGLQEVVWRRKFLLVELSFPDVIVSRVQEVVVPLTARDVATRHLLGLGLWRLFGAVVFH